jgi:cytoskeletal protein CcmA (bactofilin family)
MFGSKKSANQGNNHTLISRDTKVVGDIHFVGELQIEGQVIGNVIVDSGKEGNLVIHEKGLVEGEVRAPSAIINGSVRGDVRSANYLELAPHAVIQGNVYYNIMEMMKGAQVNGSLVRIDEKAESTKKIESISKAKPVTQM